MAMPVMIKKWLSHDSSFDMSAPAPVSHKCGIWVVTVRPSNKFYQGARLRCFASQDFAKAELVDSTIILWSIITRNMIGMGEIIVEVLWAH